MFRKMADIYNYRVDAWQRRFMGELFKAVFSLRGRVNFTNLARFSRLHEQTFRRHFKKAFQWVWFNLVILRLRRHPEEPIIGAFDCTFLPKSGTETWGIGRFFSSLAGRPKKGLEVSVLGIVATSSRRAFGVDATQTPSDLPTGKKDGYSRVDFYLEQITDLYDQLADLGGTYWVGDGFYAKQKVFDTVTDLGGDLITRLRSDANLRYLYTGPPKEGPGPRRDPELRNSTTAKLTGAIPKSLPSDSTRPAVCRISPTFACLRQSPIVPTLGGTFGSCCWWAPTERSRSSSPQQIPISTPKRSPDITACATRLNL